MRGCRESNFHRRASSPPEAQRGSGLRLPTVRCGGQRKCPPAAFRSQRHQQASRGRATSGLLLRPRSPGGRCRLPVRRRQFRSSAECHCRPHSA